MLMIDGIFDLEQIARENETKDVERILREYNYKLEQAEECDNRGGAKRKER